MSRRILGAVLPGAALLSVALCGCAAPMTARQAQNRASASLRRYCADTAPCGPVRFTGAQHMKQGWLVEYDAATAKYGVFVHNDRATDVSVWTKDVPR